MAKQLRNGNAYAYSVLADRAFGKMKNQTDLSGPEGRAIQLMVKVVKPSVMMDFNKFASRLLRPVMKL
jgi:hypothetical protein